MGDFFFFETALKVQNTNTDRSMQHLHARLHDNFKKMEIRFLCGMADFCQTFILKRLTNPMLGADGEEREIRQKAHIKK